MDRKQKFGKMSKSEMRLFPKSISDYFLLYQPKIEEYIPINQPEMRVFKFNLENNKFFPTKLKHLKHTKKYPRKVIQQTIKALNQAMPEKPIEQGMGPLRKLELRMIFLGYFLLIAISLLSIYLREKQIDQEYAVYGLFVTLMIIFPFLYKFSNEFKAELWEVERKLPEAVKSHSAAVESFCVDFNKSRGAETDGLRLIQGDHFGWIEVHFDNPDLFLIRKEGHEGLGNRSRRGSAKLVDVKMIPKEVDFDGKRVKTEPLLEN